MDVVHEVFQQCGFDRDVMEQWCEQYGGSIVLDDELFADGVQYLGLVKVSVRVEAFKMLGFSPEIGRMSKLLVERDWFDHRASCRYGLVVVDGADEGLEYGGPFVAMMPAHLSSWNASGLAVGCNIGLHFGPSCLASFPVGREGREGKDTSVGATVQVVEQSGVVVVDDDMVDDGAVSEFRRLLGTAELTEVVPGYDLGGDLGFGYGIVFDGAIREYAQQVLGPFPTLGNLLAVYACSWRVGLAVGQFRVEDTGVGLFISQDGTVDTQAAMGQLVACGMNSAVRGLRVGMVVSDNGACYLDFVQERYRAGAYNMYGVRPFLDEPLAVAAHCVLPAHQLLDLRANVVGGTCIHVCEGGQYSLVELIGGTGVDLPFWLQRVYSGNSTLGALFTCHHSEIKIGGKEVVAEVGFGATLESFGSLCVQDVLCEGLEFRMGTVGDDGACVVLVRGGDPVGLVPLRKYSSEVCFEVLRRLEHGPSGAKLLRCVTVPENCSMDVGAVGYVPRLPVMAYFKRFPVSSTFRDMDTVLLREAAAVGLKLTVE